ncbi:CHASE2 domain-containing protein [Vibrio owensii]|uniref:CHASE2 domain-containing protein n=1 Tax=Vibrio owensii TaxID=696485 RepID=UPI003391F8F8
MMFDKRIFSKALLATIPLVFIFVIDPLGMRSAAEEHYEDHILRGWSPFFSEVVSDDITVILIDDAFIEKINKWPVPYKTLSGLLKRVSQYDPQMVFFDFLQHHEHSKNLNRWLKTLSKQPYPVFMGSDPRFDNISRMSDPESIRYKISQATELVAVGWDGHGRYYPMQVKWNDSIMNTAAKAMFDSWCDQNTACAHRRGTNYSRSMIVQWSNKYSPQHQLYYPQKQPCNSIPDSRWSQFTEIMSISFTQGIRDEKELDEVLRVRCLPFLTVSATKLWGNTRLSPDELKKAIKNKIILIGYNLSGGTDLVRSPVHGSIPGVYHHAMALDNLIQLDGFHWRVPEKSGIFSLSFADLLEIFVQYFALLWVIWFRIKMTDSEANDIEQSKIQKILLASIPTMLIVSVILGSILISHYVLKIGAPSWYGLLLILFIDIPVFLIYIARTVIPVELIRIRVQLIMERGITLFNLDRS